MNNTVSREVYEAALETNADQSAVIEELQNEIEKLQNEIEKLTDANQRLKRVIRLILNRTDLLSRSFTALKTVIELALEQIKN